MRCICLVKVILFFGVFDKQQVLKKLFWILVTQIFNGWILAMADLKTITYEMNDKINR